jgi:hypothetical protein
MWSRLGAKQLGQLGDRDVDFAGWVGYHPGCEIVTVVIACVVGAHLACMGINKKKKKAGLRPLTMECCYHKHAPDDSLTKGPSARQYKM